MRSEEIKRHQLVIGKRRATALLALVTVAFVAVTKWGGDSTTAGYVQATAEAAMVGGLADWVAVTALFRHPLGVPIPHTAIVVERKQQFAQTLGDFIQQSFLTRDVVVDRVRNADVVGRVSAWLCAPENSDRLAGHLLDGAVALADVLKEEEVHAAIEGVVRSRIDATPLAPLAGRALRVVTEDGRHDQLVDSALRGLDQYLDEHRDELHARLATQSPWWLPGAVEDRIFERLLDGARLVVASMAADKDHTLRQELDTRLAKLAADLESSPDLYERGEALKRDLLSQPQLRAWTATVWTDVKRELRAQAADAESVLRRRLAEGLAGAGARLRDDPALAARADEGIETAVGYVVEHFGDEISKLVTGTIDRWDAEETSRRLELLLGPDLQYIRINGTVVGGMAGLALHGIAQVLH